MKKMMHLLAVLLMMGTVSLGAQEETAVKKVIPDALAAFTKFEFDQMWSYWCEDGSVEQNGIYLTIADMKRNGKYVQLLDLSKMKQAKNLEELLELLVRSGDMTGEQKKKVMALSDKQKKQTFKAMQQAIRMQCAMAKVMVQGVLDSMKYHSVKIEGDTAVAEISVESPLTGGGNMIVTYKKIKDAWKIYSVQEKPLPAEQKK